jgi:hypothetical protein
MCVVIGARLPQDSSTLNCDTAQLKKVSKPLAYGAGISPYGDDLVSQPTAAVAKAPLRPGA